MNQAAGHQPPSEGEGHSKRTVTALLPFLRSGARHSPLAPGLVWVDPGRDASRDAFAMRRSEGALHGVHPDRSIQGGAPGQDYPVAGHTSRAGERSARPSRGLDDRTSRIAPGLPDRPGGQCGGSGTRCTLRAMRGARGKA